MNFLHLCGLWLANTLQTSYLIRPKWYLTSHVVLHSNVYALDHYSIWLYRRLPSCNCAVPKPFYRSERGLLMWGDDTSRACRFLFCLSPPHEQCFVIVLRMFCQIQRVKPKKGYNTVVKVGYIALQSSFFQIIWISSSFRVVREATICFPCVRIQINGHQ